MHGKHIPSSGKSSVLGEGDRKEIGVVSGFFKVAYLKNDLNQIRLKYKSVKSEGLAFGYITYIKLHSFFPYFFGC